MKKFRTVFLWPLVLLTGSVLPFISCEKSNDSPPAQQTIQGSWVGTISIPSSSQFYALSIKADGKLTFEGFTEGQEQFGAGTWTLVGSDFSASVTTLYGFESNVGTVQALTAKFDIKTGILSEGKHWIPSTTTPPGTFSVTKVE